MTTRVTRRKLLVASLDLEIAEDLAEAKIFREAQPCPLPEREIDEEGEQYYPRIAEQERRQRVPTHEVIADDGNDERFDGEKKCHTTTFFDLCRDKLLGERDHDEEWENGNSGETGTVVNPADNEDDEDRERNDGERDGDAREVEQAEFFQDKPRDHSDQDDAYEDGDAILQPVRVEGEESEGDDGRGIDAESLYPDDLTEKCHESRDYGQHQKQRDCLYRDALLNEEEDEGMI